MVAKQIGFLECANTGYLLAKIHMVAKHKGGDNMSKLSYLLAKIHMVAKLITCLNA